MWATLLYIATWEIAAVAWLLAIIALVLNCLPGTWIDNVLSKFTECP